MGKNKFEHSLLIRGISETNTFYVRKRRWWIGLPWLKIFMMVIVLTLALAAFFVVPALPAELTGEQIQDIYKYVRELEIKNEQLELQLEVQRRTIEMSKSYTIDVNTQVQALLALYDHRLEQSDKLILQYESTILRLDQLTDKLDKKLGKLEWQRDLFLYLSVLGVGYGASR